MPHYLPSLIEGEGWLSEGDREKRKRVLTVQGDSVPRKVLEPLLDKFDDTDVTREAFGRDVDVDLGCPVKLTDDAVVERAEVLECPFEQPAVRVNGPLRRRQRLLRGGKAVRIGECSGRALLEDLCEILVPLDAFAVDFGRLVLHHDSELDSPDKALPTPVAHDDDLTLGCVGVCRESSRFVRAEEHMSGGDGVQFAVPREERPHGALQIWGVIASDGDAERHGQWIGDATDGILIGRVLEQRLGAHGALNHRLAELDVDAFNRVDEKNLADTLGRHGRLGACNLSGEHANPERGWANRGGVLLIAKSAEAHKVERGPVELLLIEKLLGRIANLFPLFADCVAVDRVETLARRIGLRTSGGNEGHRRRGID